MVEQPLADGGLRAADGQGAAFHPDGMGYVLGVPGHHADRSVPGDPELNVGVVIGDRNAGEALTDRIGVHGEGGVVLPPGSIRRQAGAQDGQPAYGSDSQGGQGKVGQTAFHKTGSFLVHRCKSVGSPKPGRARAGLSSGPSRPRWHGWPGKRNRWPGWAGRVWPTDAGPRPKTPPPRWR